MTKSFAVAEIGVKSFWFPADLLNDDERLEAFEMRVWRRTVNISWVDKVSNAEVLQKVQENKSILNTVQQRKLRYTLRHESLLRDTIEGTRQDYTYRMGQQSKPL